MLGLQDAKSLLESLFDTDEWVSQHSVAATAFVLKVPKDCSSYKIKFSTDCSPAEAREFEGYMIV